MTSLGRRLFVGTFPDGPGTMPLGPAPRRPEGYDPTQLGARIFALDPDCSDPAATIELGEPYLDAAYLALHPRLPLLYSVHRSADGGAMAAWTLDRSDPAGLRLLSVHDSHGAEPCHITVSPDGRHLFVANYRGPTVASYRLADNGAVAACVDVVHHDGNGPDLRRQQAAHPHMVLTDPLTGQLLVCDLGADRVFAYRVEDSGRLHPCPEASSQLLAGSGPRHAVFAKGGNSLVVLNELDSTVVLLQRQARGFRMTDVVSTVPQNAPRNNPSAIRTSADSSLVYVANRGHNSIATLSIQPDGASIMLTDVTACGGRRRDFIIDALGDRLLVANPSPGLVAGMPLSHTGRPRAPDVFWTATNASSLVLTQGTHSEVPS